MGRVTRSGAAGSVPLARLMAMAFRSIIDELHRRLRARGFTEVRPAFGFALLHVRDHGATAQDLAELMGMTKQAAAKLVDAMEAAGLVRRGPHPDDGRARRLALAPRGRALLRTVEAIYRDIEAEWASVIGRARVEELRAGLEEVLRAAHGELPAVRPVW